MDLLKLWGSCVYRFLLKAIKKKFEELKPYAMKLGSAFQKINFFKRSER